MSAARDGTRAAIVAGALHALSAGAGIALGLTGTSEWYDQAEFHLPAIERFAAELPTPVLSDYLSATTPGYHLLMAVLWRMFASLSVLHFVNAMFGVAVVAILASMVGRRSGWKVGAAAGALIGCSPYLLSSSIWLTTDNFGLTLMLLVIAASLPIAAGAAPVSASWRAALVAAVAAFVRQILAYLAAVPAAAVVARWAGERRKPLLCELAMAGASMLPALAVVGAFVLLWGGLVPPSFREYHGAGANPVTPVYALALVGVWGAVVFSSMPGFLRTLLSPRAIVAGFVTGAIACAVESDFVQHVRWGGVLWSVAKLAPDVAGRSLVLVPLAGLGGAVLVAFLRLWLEARRRERAGSGAAILPLLVLAGAIAAQTANQQCFERYLQPTVVLLCVLSASIFAGRSMRAAPLVAGAVLAAALSAVNVARPGG